MFLKEYFLVPFIFFNTFISSIRIIEMKENISSFDSNRTVARVKNLDLSSYTEITMCIRVLFYKFPVETNYRLKWFLIFSSEMNYILFNTAAHDTEYKYQYFAIPKRMYQGSLQKKWKQFILMSKKSHFQTANFLIVLHFI